jgi:hypothetical protein
VASEEPLGDVIDDVEPFPTEPMEPIEDRIGEAAQVPGQVPARIPLEIAPFAFLFVQLRAVLNHLEPRRARGQPGLTHLAGVAGPVIQHQDNVPPCFRMPLLERLEIVEKTGRGLVGTEHFNPPAAEDLDAAEGGQPAIGAHGQDDRLLPAPMPDPRKVGIGLQVRLILMVQFIPLGCGDDPVPPLPPVRRCTQRLRRGLAGA